MIPPIFGGGVVAGKVDVAVGKSSVGAADVAGGDLTDDIGGSRVGVGGGNVGAGDTGVVAYDSEVAGV